MRSLLFALPHHRELAVALARDTGMEHGHAAVGRFPNGELWATLGTPCEGRPCTLLGATAPPDADLLGTLLLADTLRRHGASDVVAVIPYLGYARQDRPEVGKSLGAAWTGQLLAAAGVTRVIAVDVHSARVAPLFPVPLRSVSPAPLFAGVLKSLELRDVVVVSPDEGARERAEAVREAAGIPRPVVWFVKTRDASGIRHLAMRGDTGPSAVVVDDILDTGGTLVSACERLRAAGTRTIVVAVTHGLFTGDRWQRLWDLGVGRIVCLDTTPRAVSDERVVSVSAAPVLVAALTGAPGDSAA